MIVDVSWWLFYTGYQTLVKSWTSATVHYPLLESITLHKTAIEEVRCLLYPTDKITLSITYDMKHRLEAEMKHRCLGSLPEVIRAILSEYVSTHPLEQARDQHY